MHVQTFAIGECPVGESLIDKTRELFIVQLELHTSVLNQNLKSIYEFPLPSLYNLLTSFVSSTLSADCFDKNCRRSSSLRSYS